MSQELEARLVSPVQVVEHEDHGTLVWWLLRGNPPPAASQEVPPSESASAV